MALRGYCQKVLFVITFVKAHKKLDHRGKNDEGFVSINGSGKFVQFRGDKTVSSFKHHRRIDNGESKTFLFGHHRLSIIDLSDDAHQPMIF